MSAHARMKRSFSGGSLTFLGVHFLERYVVTVAVAIVSG